MWKQYSPFKRFRVFRRCLSWKWSWETDGPCGCNSVGGEYLFAWQAARDAKKLLRMC
jgi:hypothetical protein